MHCRTIGDSPKRHIKLSEVNSKDRRRRSLLMIHSPTKILRSFPPLQAETVKEVTLTLIKKIPNDVYAEIVSHAK